MALTSVTLPSYNPDYRNGLLAFETDLNESMAVQKEIVGTGMFTCNMCLGLMERPLYLPFCSHGVCEPCLIKYWSTTLHNLPHGIMHCPACRANVPSIYSLRQFSRFTEFEKRWFRLIDVRCPNNCGKVIPLAEMRDHRVRFCEHRLVECPHFNCSFVCLPNQLQDHFLNCEEICVLSRCCRLPYNEKDKENHECDKLRRRLNATNRTRYRVSWQPYHTVFKFPARAQYERFKEYLSFIEHPNINPLTADATIPEPRLPRRPLPTFIATPGDVIPPAVLVVPPSEANTENGVEPIDPEVSHLEIPDDSSSDSG